MKYLRMFLIILFIPWNCMAQNVPMSQASLQRGAKWFMNYCIGCHSLKYMRYNALAQGIGITDKQQQVVTQLVKDNLIFTGARLSDEILTSQSEAEGKQFFGISPPDLTLVVRVRGRDWLYGYLKGFYADPKRPWGVNNVVFPGVAMPNVFVNLQGIQVPTYTTGQVIDHLTTLTPGSMSPEEFDVLVNDLVNFLTYVAEPSKAERHKMGRSVLIFMLLLALIAYLLKKEYWKDV